MHKKFNFITSRGQFTGKTCHKIFLKQFLADSKIIRDSIIMITVSPKCQMFIKRVKKQRARNFDRISWNSNRQSPCEINCDLICVDVFVKCNFYLPHVGFINIPTWGFICLLVNKYLGMFFENQDLQNHQ